MGHSHIHHHAVDLEVIRDSELDLVCAAGTGPFTIWPLLNPAPEIPSGNGTAYDNAFLQFDRPATAEARQEVESAEQKLYESMDQASRAIVDVRAGTFADGAQRTVEAYQDLQDAQDKYEETAKKENDRASDEAHVTQQIANGHNESPAGANMTNNDGSPGVGGSSGGGGAVANQEPYSGPPVDIPSGLVNPGPSYTPQIILEPLGNAY